MAKALRLKGNGSQAAGSLTDAVIKLVGADYITVRDFTITENAANLTTDAGTNNMTEWGVAVLPASATNGAQNITLKGLSIALSKAYANSFGIYSNTAHTGGAIDVVADISASSGINTNLKIYSNTISEVNAGIAIIGSPEFPGTGLDIGGQTSAQGNILTEWGTTAAYAAYARLDNKINASTSVTFISTVHGILAVNQIAPNISHNSLTSATMGNTDGVLVGIYAVANGAFVYPGNATTTKINSNTLNLSSAVFGSASTIPLIQGIRVGTGDLVSTLQMDTTTVSGINHLTANSPGNDTIMYSTAQVKHLSMNANKFKNFSIGNAGGVALMAVQGRVFMPADGTQNFFNNEVQGISRTSTAAIGQTSVVTRVLITSATAADGSEAGSSFNVSQNSISNVETNGGSFTAIVNFDGKQGLPTLTKNISNNSVTGIHTNFTSSTQTSGGAVVFANFTNRGGGHVISDNVVDQITTANPATFGNISGVTTASTTSGMSFTITGNAFTNWTGGQLIGINFGGTPGSISENTFYNWSGNVTVGAGMQAINIATALASSTLDITRNKIGNINNALIGTINAINVSSGAAAFNINIHNNLIGSLTTPVASNLNAIQGINLNGAMTATVEHNTIYLNASSSAATFGSSCVLFTNTVSSLQMRNNILINASTPAQEGLNVATNGIAACLRRTAVGTPGAAPANYSLASNNNLFYVNATAGSNNHLTYVEGAAAGTIANQQNSLADFKTFMVNRDQASVTDNTANPFQSMVAADAGFLHLNTGIAYAASNAGVGIPAISIDYDGNTRNGTTPDIGADEYEVVLPVSLVSLSGVRQGISNLLTWVTKSEQNNRGFDLQRSLNGTNFSTIATVASKAANGNSNGTLTYEFTDAKIAGADTYYRLVQTDLDGKTRLSNTVLIAAAMPAVSKLQGLFPNPASNNLGLYISAVEQDKAIITIVDAAGRILQRKNASLARGYNTVNINVNSFKAGIYFVSVQLAESKGTETLRFIKQ